MAFLISINWVGDTLAVRPKSVTVVPIIDGTRGSAVQLTEVNGYKADVSGTSFFTTEATAEVTSSHPDYTISVKDSTSGSFPTTSFKSVITMTYNSAPPPPKKSVSIKVKFVGDTAYPEVRPQSIKASLMKSGVLDRETTLNQLNQWKTTWKELDGNYDWTVSVPNITNYQLHLTNDGNGNFTAKYTCTYIPPTVSVTGQVKFIGDEAYLSIRPNNVVLSLKQAGVEKQTATVNAASSWSKTWTDLPEGNWTVDGPELQNYSRQISHVGTSFTITYTCTYVPPKESVFAKVQFVGDENHPELRPVYVALALNNGGVISFPFDVGEGWNWSWKWGEQEGADKCTVQFEEVPNYRLEIHKETNGSIQFTGVYTCTYVEPPQPDPAPGNHPNKEDYDLMYSVLYDDISAENMIDIIHILNYGDHGTSIVE